MKKYLLALLFIFGFGLFISNKTYAVSDISVTFEKNQVIQGNTSYFSNCTSDCLKDYNYLIIERLSTDSELSGVANNNLSLGFSQCHYGSNTSCGNRWLNVPVLLTYMIYDFNFSSQSYTVWFGNQNSSTYTFPASYKLTLTENLPLAPSECPEPPEPDCPDPEENSQYINVVLDSFWKYQKAFAGAVVAIIVIFIVYRLIKGVLR